LRIFWRINIGYACIIILLALISSLALLKFNQLKNLTKSIITYDYPSSDLEKKLIDSILSQVGFERKYLILEDLKFYQSFNAKEEENLAHFNKLLQLAETPNAKALVEKAHKRYLEYLDMVKAEVVLVRSKKKYPLFLYQQNKEKVITVINQTLDELINLNKLSISAKIGHSEEASNQAGKLIGSIAILSLLISITISILITRGINKPLKTLEQATKSIAQGDFNQKVDISSPPEIERLAKAFTFMCNRLQELDNLKKDFISNISHELRTPLTSIKEASHLLREGAIGEISSEQKEFLEVILEEGEKLDQYINNLLDLSKMEAGMMSYSWQSCDLTQIINHIAQGLRPVAQKKDIQLDIAIQEVLPLVIADSRKLQQVITNLLSNALKFTPPEGKITISASTALGSAVASSQPLKPGTGFDNQEGIKVSVSDMGPGIPKEDWERVFDKFYQIGRGVAASYPGSGLGLAIAQRIVEDHVGRIWVESELDKGSIFTFFLPLR